MRSLGARARQTLSAIQKTTGSPASVVSTLGQAVATLVDQEEDAGYHEVRFDGSNLASGVYFCLSKAGPFVRTSRLLLVR
jgi:hypothetical protein